MAHPRAALELDGRRVEITAVHPLPPIRGEGLTDWKHSLASLPSPDRDGGAVRILAGDFNASQDHAAFRRILDTGLRDAARLTGADRTPTWPSRPTPAFGTQIDHVLVSEDFAAHRARFLDLENTDHRALVVDLTLHGA